MRKLLALAIWCLPSFWLLAGFTHQPDARADLPRPADTAVATKSVAVPETYIVRAKFYITKGPCIQLGNFIAMPAVDAFEVIEVVQGKLNAKHILVRPVSGLGPDYPKALAEGKVYTLRLTAAAPTSQQLRENKKEGGTSVWVDGDEIQELKLGP